MLYWYQQLLSGSRYAFLLVAVVLLSCQTQAVKSDSTTFSNTTHKLDTQKTIQLTIDSSSIKKKVPTIPEYVRTESDSTRVETDTINFIAVPGIKTETKNNKNDTTKKETGKEKADTIKVKGSLPHLDTAFKYSFVRETNGPNRNVWIDLWNKSVGARLGDPWCASFVSFCLRQGGVSEPTTRSASSRAFATKKAWKATDVLQGRYEPKKGDILVWANGETWTGHIGFIAEDYKKNSFKTIEGNTSSGTKGSQRDGNGVYVRTRSIQPLNYFRIRWVVEVKYMNSIKTQM